MDSEELSCLLKRDKLIKEKFTNEIYCYDNLPSKLEKGKFYIFNTLSFKSDFKEPGHWMIFLFYSATNQLVFFDPFGNFPSKNFILPMLKSVDTNTSLFFNNVQLQNHHATTCGQHVLAIATLFSHNVDAYSILTKFYRVGSKTNSDIFKYDKIVNQFLQNYFGESRSITWDEF